MLPGDFREADKCAKEKQPGYEGPNATPLKLLRDQGCLATKKGLRGGPALVRALQLRRRMSGPLEGLPSGRPGLNCDARRASRGPGRKPTPRCAMNSRPIPRALRTHPAHLGRDSPQSKAGDPAVFGAAWRWMVTSSPTPPPSSGALKGLPERQQLGLLPPTQPSHPRCKQCPLLRTAQPYVTERSTEDRRGIYLELSYLTVRSAVCSNSFWMA